MSAQPEQFSNDENFRELLRAHFGFSAPSSAPAEFPQTLRTLNVADEFWHWLQLEVTNERLGPEEWGDIVGTNIGRETDSEKQQADWRNVKEELMEVWKLSYEATGRPDGDRPAFPIYDGRFRAVTESPPLPGSAADLTILNRGRPAALGHLPGQGPRNPGNPKGFPGPRSPRL